MKKAAKLVLLLSALAFMGCASNVKTWDSASKQMKGIPANKPTLVKITKVTSYKEKPGSSAQEKEYCKEDQRSEDYDIMSLGEPYFIEFDPASMAKGSFKVTFSDKGLLSAVELNSDPGVTENIGKVTELLGTILPYAAAKKAAESATAAALPAAGPSADELKAKYCLTKETKIEKIEKFDITTPKP